MQPILIKGGRIIDTRLGIDEIGDLLIEDGIIKTCGGNIEPSEIQGVIIASGLIVSPGFIDIHCHLRDPGFEYKETLATGTAAAAAGGFTTVCAMPNTRPEMDTRATVEFVLEKARAEGIVRVLPIGCVTKNSQGRELAEMGELAQAGVVGFSDDGHPVLDPNLMRQALIYARAFDLPIINHCEIPELSRGRPIHEGWVSNRLGVVGVPTSAESIMVARDISLAALTDGRLHLAHISTEESVGLIRNAKEKGLAVTCEVTPHHLSLSEETLLGSPNIDAIFNPLSPNAYDTNAKVNPPLRSMADVDAMISALKEGIIDFIATDHAPHSTVDKLTTLDEAAFGISVLETALASMLTLMHKGKIELSLVLEKLTAAPAHFLGKQDIGTLRPGSIADITIFDPDSEWVVDSSKFLSKGKNTPLNGHSLKGRVITTIVGGTIVYSVNPDE